MATAEWLVVAAAAAAPIALVALGPRFAAPPPARLTIAALHVYPVKSMAPLHLDQLKLDAHGGAELDRRWMVVRATPDDDGAHRFMSQRQLPAMATVVPTLEERVLQLSCGAMAAPLRLPLQPDDDADASVVAKVWGARMAAQDCGDAAAAWLSACLNAPLRLVRMRRDHCGEGLPRALDETAVAELQRAGGLEADAPQEGLAFVDGHPLLVVCDASLSDLNRRLRAANLSYVQYFCVYRYVWLVMVITLLGCGCDVPLRVREWCMSQNMLYSCCFVQSCVLRS